MMAGADTHSSLLLNGSLATTGKVALHQTRPSETSKPTALGQPVWPLMRIEAGSERVSPRE